MTTWHTRPTQVSYDTDHVAHVGLGGASWRMLYFEPELDFI
jgi:hypothetical protein